LGATTPSITSQRTAAFLQRLPELGWAEGRNVAIEYRWAEGRSERYTEIAAEFVRLKIDVIVTTGVPAVFAAKQATSVIPIVFGWVGTGPWSYSGLEKELRSCIRRHDRSYVVPLVRDHLRYEIRRALGAAEAGREGFCFFSAGLFSASFSAASLANRSSFNRAVFARTVSPSAI
jgi:hypothetical protein